MADRQRRRLAILARHLEPGSDCNAFTTALASGTCGGRIVLDDALLFNSLSATTLNSLNAKASLECLPLNSLSAETLNSVNAAATASLSSLTLDSLPAGTLNTLRCRTIPVVDRCQGPVPRFDRLLAGQQKASKMCVQEADKMGQELGGNETKALLCNLEEGQEEHLACLDDQPPNFYIQHIL